MKVLLIMPDANIHRIRLGRHVRSMREAPLTLATLAGVTLNNVTLEYKLVDGSIDPYPMDYPADLVGISVLTGTANRAYALADEFRRKKIPVVLGGVHVTIFPEEASKHADAVVVGMAEKSWPLLLGDFSRGQLRKTYQQPVMKGDVLEEVPVPRLDLMRRSGYMIPNTVQATRGCKHSCDFCTVPAVWPDYYKRPVGDVIRDIRSLNGNRFVFNDVSLLDDPDYAIELLTALIPFKKKWGGLATIQAAMNPYLMDIASRSGCIYLLIGFESVCQLGLNNIFKGFNRVDQYKEAVRCLHGHDISIQGCFVFGMDNDEGKVFSDTLGWVRELKIDIPRYSIYTPYPGTKLFNRLMKESRILSFNWKDYDTMHVVFQPKLMSPETLYEGFKNTYRETFRFASILNRSRKLSFNSVINGLGNMAYRRFVKRLYNDDFYSAPHSANACHDAANTAENDKMIREVS